MAEGEVSEKDSGLAAALPPFLDGHSLAGAVTLVVTKDLALDLKAVGFADIAAKKPMKPDARFWIATQPKPMTAAALKLRDFSSTPVARASCGTGWLGIRLKS